MDQPYLSILNTDLSKENLVIDTERMKTVKGIKKWFTQSPTIKPFPVFSKKIMPGYRALFWGPNGSGKKSFTAHIAGELNKDAYIIDVSMIVSKYIGETEKNLELLFARAEDKGWILFFDEADALFGKRTNVKDAHDRYANQAIDYLLQRIEEFKGLVILSTNMKNDIDSAFVRRFNSILHFPSC
jgi:SpoVK/Ycf46/Vps4 family AAA+-type ATPase